MAKTTMLTPEQRAIRALSDPMGAIVPGHAYDLVLARVTDAIRVAVAEAAEATRIGLVDAALLAELDAARAVVAAARVACEASLFDQRGPLVTAVARYDWAVQEATKARSE